MSATLYTTPQALIDAFGEAELIELTDRADPRANDVDLAIAQGACDRAAAEIDAALAGRYSLPLAAIPELLKYLALDLARYYLHEREPSPLVKARFDSARETLRELGSGRKSLGSDAVGAAVRPPPLNLAEFAQGAKDWARGAW
jgi:phage gp36-like protein